MESTRPNVSIERALAGLFSALEGGRVIHSWVDSEGKPAGRVIAKPDENIGPGYPGTEGLTYTGPLSENEIHNEIDTLVERATFSE